MTDAHYILWNCVRHCGFSVKHPIPRAIEACHASHVLPSSRSIPGRGHARHAQFRTTRKALWTFRQSRTV